MDSNADNRSPRIVYHDVRPDVYELIDGYVQKWRWLIPNWVRELHIRFWDAAEGAGGTIASTELSFEYAEQRIDIYSAWLNRSDRARENAIIHELCHGYVSLVGDYALSFAAHDKYAAEVKFRAEIGTTDLADRLQRTFGQARVASQEELDRLAVFDATLRLLKAEYIELEQSRRDRVFEQEPLDHELLRKNHEHALRFFGVSVDTDEFIQDALNGEKAKED